MAKIYRRKVGNDANGNPILDSKGKPALADTWWGYYSLGGGKRFRVSLHTTNASVANDRLARLQLGKPMVEPTVIAAKGEIVVSGKAALPLGVAVERFLASDAIKCKGTLDSYTGKCVPLLRILGPDIQVGAITAALLDEYVDTRYAEAAHRVHVKGPDKGQHKPLSPVTIFKELNVLRGVMNWCQPDRKNPGSEIDVAEIIPVVEGQSKPIMRWHTMEELGKLLAVLPEHRRTWVALAGYSGARFSEVEGVQPYDVKDNGFIRLNGTKTPEAQRTVPIAPLLRRYLKPGMLPVIPWKNVSRDLEAACIEAGVPRVTPNDLRRSFCSRLCGLGVPSLIIARMMGHTTTRMVEMVYAMLGKEDYRSAVVRAFSNETPSHVLAEQASARTAMSAEDATLLAMALRAA